MRFGKMAPQPHQEFLGVYSPGASINPGNNLQNAVNNGSYSNAVKVVKRKYLRTSYKVSYISGVEKDTSILIV